MASDVEMWFNNIIKQNSILSDKMEYLTYMANNLNFKIGNDETVYDNNSNNYVGINTFLSEFINRTNKLRIPIFYRQYMYLNSFHGSYRLQNMICHDGQLYFINYSNHICHIDLNWTNLLYNLVKSDSPEELTKSGIIETVQDIIKGNFISIINRYKLHQNVTLPFPINKSLNSDLLINNVSCHRLLFNMYWEYFKSEFKWSEDINLKDNDLLSSNLNDDKLNDKLDDKLDVKNLDDDKLDVKNLEDISLLMDITYQSRDQLLNLKFEHFEIMLRYGYIGLEKIGEALIKELIKILNFLPNTIYTVSEFNVPSKSLYLSDIFTIDKISYRYSTNSECRGYMFQVNNFDHLIPLLNKLPENFDPQNIIFNNIKNISLEEQIKLTTEYDILPNTYYEFNKETRKLEF